MSYAIKAEYVAPRLGYYGGWNAIVVTPNYGDVIVGYCHKTEVEALRSAEKSRKAWAGERLDPVMGFVRVDGEIGEEDLGDMSPSYTKWNQQVDEAWMRDDNRL